MWQVSVFNQIGRSNFRLSGGRGHYFRVTRRIVDSVLQTALLDGGLFNPLPLGCNRLPAPKIEVGQRQILQAFMVLLVVRCLGKPYRSTAVGTQSLLNHQKGCCLPALWWCRS